MHTACFIGRKKKSRMQFRSVSRKKDTLFYICLAFILIKICCSHFLKRFIANYIYLPMINFKASVQLLSCPAFMPFRSKWYTNCGNCKPIHLLGHFVTGKSPISYLTETCIAFKLENNHIF